MEFAPEQGQTLLETWHLSIPADGTPESVRYLPDRDGVRLCLWDGETWQELSTEEMGSYLRFDTDRTELELAVVAEASHTALWIYAAGGLAALAIIAVLLVVSKWKKRPAAK